jgi:hypothetical protein
LNNGDETVPVNASEYFPASTVVDRFSGQFRWPGKTFELKPGGVLILDKTW